MKNSILKLSTLFLFFVAPSLATASISVTLRLDRKEATIDDSIRVFVTISGAQEALPEPILHGLGDFVVTKGGSTRRVEIIDGRLNAALEYTYFIQPKRTGSFQIGPAEVEVGGKILKSNEETLRIQKAPPARADQGRLFLGGTPSKKKAYVGEQVIYSLKLYRRVKVSDITLEFPETEHITFRQLGRPIEYLSERGGHRYRTIEVRYGLIPAREGNYSIQPFRINLTVYESRRGSPRGFFDDPFFDMPFFARGRPITLATKPFELEVVPLPEKGRPAAFSGLVGSFELESALSASKIRVGESTTLTVRLGGSGNLSLIPDLKLPDIAGAKVYADEPVMRIEPASQGLWGSKTMRWEIVPDRQGDYQIPPLSITFFDPEAQQYRTLKTPPYTLVVLPGKGKMIMVFLHAPQGRVSERLVSSPMRPRV